MSEIISRKRSQIWTMFDVIDENTAKCCVCSSVLSYKSGSIQNLKRHVHAKHSDVQDLRPGSVEAVGLMAAIDDSTLITAPTATSTFISSSSRVSVITGDHVTEQNQQLSGLDLFKNSLPNIKSKFIDQQLIKMIVKEYHPFSIVDDVEFKKLLEMLNPRYNLPTKKTITTYLLPKIYKEIKENVQLEMQSCSVAALAVDGWTSVSNQNFLSITAHYISEDNCDMRSYLLDSFEWNDQQHTPENICSKLQMVVRNWNLENKIIAVVSYPIDNIVAAIRLGNWVHIECFAYKISSIVRNAIVPINPICEKINAIVEFFKRSPNAMKRLQATQTEMNLIELKLKQDVVTRWNSTYIMLKCYLELKEPIAYVLPQLNTNLELPSYEELQLIENICEILKIFEDVTIEIFNEKNFTLSKVKIFTTALIKFISNKCEEVNLEKEIQDMLNIITEEFEKKFTLEILPSPHLHYEASLLDPRFKKLAFTENEHINQIIEAAAETATQFNLSESMVPDSNAPKSSSLVWYEFDRMAFNVRRNASAAKIEMNQYLMDPILDRNMDPLLWWKDRKSIYPHLFQLAKHRLCIPATSVPCDRVFSKTGQNLTMRRSQLSALNITELLFLNSNM